MLGSGFPTLELKHPSESSQLTIVIIALSENQEAEMSLVNGSSLKCQRGSQTIGQWEILTWKSFNPGPRDIAKLPLPVTEKIGEFQGSSHGHSQHQL
jgi:hypothetical protein